MNTKGQWATSLLRNKPALSPIMYIFLSLVPCLPLLSTGAIRAVFPVASTHVTLRYTLFNEGRSKNDVTNKNKFKGFIDMHV